MERNGEIGETGAGKLLDDHRLEAEIPTRPAIGLGKADPEQPRRASPAPGGAIDLPLLPPTRDMRHDLGLDEAADGGAKGVEQRFRLPAGLPPSARGGPSGHIRRQVLRDAR